MSFTSLLPPGPSVELSGLLDRLDLIDRAGADSGTRPYTLLNMVSSADGRATLDGRSGGIGDDGDKLLFHGLRTRVDAVMAGAGTLRVERYGRLVRDADGLAARRALGLAEQPLACVVSGRLALDESIPLLADPDSRVVILTASRASLPAACRAQIEYVRCALAAGAAGGQIGGGQIDLAAGLAALRSRFGVRTLLCEGGPHLNANLLAAGLVDELFLSLAPSLAGGDAGRNGTDSGDARLASPPPIGQRARRVSPDFGSELRIVTGPDLDPPVGMRLVSLHEHRSHLFLRYEIDHGPARRR